MNVDSLLQLEPVGAARRICCYVALPDEVETQPLVEALWARGVAVSVPKMSGKGKMAAVRIRAWTELTPGQFGVLEPRIAVPTDDMFDVVIVPGQMFTLRGDRQGRGHGYYDRFLAAHPAAIRIALAREAQIVDALPTQAHDEPVDWIVTESRSIETQARRVRQSPH